MMVGGETFPPRPWAGGGVYVLDDHELVRRGLRLLLESDGLGVAGESGSAREALRRILALRPDLAILDVDLPDGSGAEMCRALAAAGSPTRCVLMTGEAEEAVLIDAILAGAWGCLSKQDDGSEQLRLIRRAMEGHTAFSARFRPALLDPAPRPMPKRPDERVPNLTRQEMNVAVRLVGGLTNRQISEEMVLAEKSVKNLVSSVLTKLGMARRTQVAVFMARKLNHPEDPAGGDYRISPFPDLVPEVTTALLDCVSETRTVPLTEAERAADAFRLANALAAARTGLTSRRPLPSGA